MSALAKYLAKKGKTVSGSDAEYMPQGTILDENIKVYAGHQSVNVIGSDLVVYTSAISTDNPELMKAVKLGKKIISRSELLGSVIKDFKNSVAISGSHGKTTTTAMLTNIFIAAKKSPTAFIGGEDKNLSNFCFGEGDTVICEACEYRKNFLDLSPTISVVLNIDDDHLDSYGNMENMISAFNEFISGTVCFINSDDTNCEKLFSKTAITFGINRAATYIASALKKSEDGYSFSVYKSGIYKTRINLKLKGKHNVYNALAAFAVSDYFSIDTKIIKSALENFSSVKRRAEKIGEIKNIPVIADYAHHPKELAASLSALSETPEKTLVIFQPHTYSRTVYLKKEFVEVLSSVRDLILYPAYAARETYIEGGSSFDLHLKLPCSAYVTDISSLLCLLRRKVKSGDLILVLGAGDLYGELKKRI